MGKKSKSKTHRRRRQKRAKPVNSDNGNTNVHVQEMADEMHSSDYVPVTRSQQLTACKDGTKLSIVELNGMLRSAPHLVISAIEAHEEVLMFCDTKVVVYGLCGLFYLACYSEDEYFRAARLSKRVIMFLLQSDADEDIQTLLVKVKTLLHYADICARMEDYDHAMKTYKGIHTVCDRIFKKDPSLKANFKWKQAQIFTYQAEVMFTKSMVIYGKVTRQARQEYISINEGIIRFYKEALTSLPNQDENMVYEFIGGLVDVCCRIAMELLRLKKWNSAREKLLLSKQIVKLSIQFVSDKSVSDVALAKIKMWIGRVYMNKYYHAKSASTTTAIENNEFLKEAIRNTTNAMSDLDRCDKKQFQHPILLDLAQQHFFLGSINTAKVSLITYLRSYLESTGKCHGCGQTNKKGEVKYVCRDCRSTFYCSRACQVQTYRGEKITFMKHRLFCPLVKSWKKFSKANPDVQQMTSREVVSTIQGNSGFKYIFDNFFLSLERNQKNRVYLKPDVSMRSRLLAEEVD